MGDTVNTLKTEFVITRSYILSNLAQKIKDYESLGWTKEGEMYWNHANQACQKMVRPLDTD